MVFQDPYSSLDPRMTIGESIAEAMPPGRRAAPQRRAEVARLLELVHLDAAPRRAPTRPSCPAASASASPWPGRSPAGPRSSSPTRSPPPSTSRSRARCSTSCASCSASSASRCSSSRTTSRSSATSRRTSPSCTAAGSSSRAPTDQVLGDPQPRLHPQLLLPSLPQGRPPASRQPPHRTQKEHP